MTAASDNKHWMESDETAKMRIDQAKALREKVAKGSGLSFETYLVPSQAEWILKMVEDGIFVDPSETIFVLMQEAQELSAHEDLRTELLNRSLQKSIDDPRPGIPAEEVMKEMEEKMKEPRPETVTWEKIDNSTHDLDA